MSLETCAPPDIPVKQTYLDGPEGGRRGGLGGPRHARLTNPSGLFRYQGVDEFIPVT